MAVTIEIPLLITDIVDPPGELATRAAPYTSLGTQYEGDESSVKGIYTFTIPTLADGEYRFFSSEGSSPLWVFFVKVSGTSAKVYDSFESMDVATSIANVPKYGDAQIWDNGTDTIEVTVTEA